MAAALALGLGGSAAPPRVDLPGAIAQKTRLKVLQAMVQVEGGGHLGTAEFQGELPGWSCWLAQ